MTDQSLPDRDREISEDSLFNGELRCLQYRDGYRFSIDPVLLAHFVRLNKDEIICDIGAGCGVLGLILLYRSFPAIKDLTAFELQAPLAVLARENARRNHFQEKLKVVEGDLCNILQHLKAESCSTVVCNPPFYKRGTGRSSRNGEALLARHQVACSLEDIVSAASAVLKNRGRLVMIYPAEGLGELATLLTGKRLVLKRLQFVYSYPDPEAKARLLLLEAVKNGGEGVEIPAPFYIYEQKNGEYTAAMQQMFEGNHHGDKN
ncbi:MAG: methyltransferase [Thermodesulfobacteriota bacterium]